VPAGASIVLRPATFVELTADQERSAVGALAELLVPLLGGSPPAGMDPGLNSDVATMGDT